VQRVTSLGSDLPDVCRLGLATRGNTALDLADVRWAVDEGIGYLNWCGHDDGMSAAIRDMGRRRSEVVVAWQMSARTADEATTALESALATLGTASIDIVTFYYVESRPEWARLREPNGAYDAMERAREAGKVRMLGLTSHQRRMAADILDAPGRPLDMLMLRYNAAHRGAEHEVFPTTDRLLAPFVAYTCLRWGELMKPTPDDPSGWEPPRAPEWYRYALANPAVSVALMAPNGVDELRENAALLTDWSAPDPDEMTALEAHGERVYHHAGRFP
jgi:aryl-alcohol dehydrogenase-like predicted oxidoreductase